MVSVVVSRAVDCGVMVSVVVSRAVDCGVMVSVVVSRAVDCRVMVSVVVSRAVDCGVMVSVVVSRAVDCGVMVSVVAVDCVIELQLDQTKNYKIGICCFSSKNPALRSKSIDWLARYLFEWSNMSTRKELFQSTSTIKIHLSVLGLVKADNIIIIISSKCNVLIMI
jgi:hypothetical protein